VTATLLFMSVAHTMSKPVYRNLGYDSSATKVANAARIHAD
jgi:hypothetical protein